MKNMHDPSVGATEIPGALKKNVIELLAPNPSDGSFSLKLNLPTAGIVAIRMIDLNGKMVEIQSFGKMERGDSTLVFQKEALLSGLYFLQVLLNNKLVGSTTFFKF